MKFRGSYRNTLCMLPFVVALVSPQYLPAQESIVLESAEDARVDAPFDQLAPINFRNEFDTDNVPFSADCTPSTGQCAFGIFDNALEMQSSINEQELESNGSFVLANISYQNRSDSFGVNAALSSRSRSDPNGFPVFTLTGTLYNDTESGGVNGGREGDVEARFRIDAFTSGSNRIIAELRRRQANGGTQRQPVFVGGEDRFTFDIDVQLDTTYILDISFNRDSGEVSFSVGGDGFETIVETISIDTVMLTPSRNTQAIQTGVFGNEAPGQAVGRGIARISEIRAGGTTYSFTDSSPTLITQFQSSRNQIPASTFQFDNGRVILTHDSNIQSTGDARITHEGPTDYVEATFEISSASSFVDGGTARAEVAATLFRDLEGDFSIFDETGTVFAGMRMEVNGTNDFGFEACAFRSNDSGFTEGSELIAMNQDFNNPDVNLNCRRFELVPQLDTPYTASLAINREMGLLTFRIQQSDNDAVSEEFVFNVPGDTFPVARSFGGIRTQTRNGSRLMTFVDSMAFAPEGSSVPVDTSSALITRDITNEVNAGTNAANLIAMGVDPTPEVEAPADTDATPDTDTDTASDTDATADTDDLVEEVTTSGGGGGCTIGTSEPDPLLPLLAMGSLLFVFMRRRSRTITTNRYSPLIKLKAIGTVLALAALTSCATTPAPQIDFFDSAAARAYVSGNTEQWSKGAGYYSEDGKLFAVWEGSTHEGTWLIKDDGRTCLTLAVWGGGIDCHRYFNDDGVVKRKWKNDIKVVEIEPGNKL